MLRVNVANLKCSKSVDGHAQRLCHACSPVDRRDEFRQHAGCATVLCLVPA